MAASGDPVPPGLLIDGAGEPTRDARSLFADPPGALLPFGGHKGSRSASSPSCSPACSAAAAPSRRRMRVTAACATTCSPCCSIRRGSATRPGNGRIHAAVRVDGIADDVPAVVDPQDLGFRRRTAVDESSRPHGAQEPQSTAPHRPAIVVVEVGTRRRQRRPCPFVAQHPHRSGRQLAGEVRSTRLPVQLRGRRQLETAQTEAVDDTNLPVGERDQRLRRGIGAVDAKAEQEGR